MDNKVGSKPQPAQDGRKRTLTSPADIPLPFHPGEASRGTRSPRRILSGAIQRYAMANVLPLHLTLAMPHAFTLSSAEPHAFRLDTR